MDADRRPNSSGPASGWLAWYARPGSPQADPTRYTDGQVLLGEPLWRPPSPKGFPDDEASWIDGMGRRLDVANNFAERIAGRTDPQDVIETVLGSQVSPEVKQAVGRAESRQQALVLLFMSAEFQEEVSMTPIASHPPTRREALIGAGGLFAWSQMPRLARAEGRDPRMLCHCAAGRARWPRCGRACRRSRLDRRCAATARSSLDGKPPALPLDGFFAPQSRDAEPAPALQGAAGDHRARDRNALSRALAFRRPGRSRKRPHAAGRRRQLGWPNRALAELASDGRGSIRAAAASLAWAR